MFASPALQAPTVSDRITAAPECASVRTFLFSIFYLFPVFLLFLLVSLFVLWCCSILMCDTLATRNLQHARLACVHTTPSAQRTATARAASATHPRCAAVCLQPRRRTRAQPHSFATTLRAYSLACVTRARGKRRVLLAR